MTKWTRGLGVMALLAAAVAQNDPRPESTRRLAALLERIYLEQDFKTDPNKAGERAAYYRRMLKSGSLDLRTEVRAREDLAENLLVSGDSAAAVEELEKLRQFARERGIIFNPTFELQVRRTLAISYLRMGEQRNCLVNHNAQSCVYPLRGGGVHADRAGAEGAVREYTAVLEKDPEDLAAKWLLNVAYMALGKAVPLRYAIAPEQFLPPESDVGKFTDVAASVGVAWERHAGGSVAEDFDGDGYFDLMISSSGPGDQILFLHNNGDGTFSNQTAEAGLTGITGGLNLIHADYNNDGLEDVLVLRGGWWAQNGKYPVSLLRNNGKNAKGQVTFTDVTEEAGLLQSTMHPTQTAAWGDYDNDGWLDLYIGHESNVQERHPSQLFHNNGDGTFTDIAPQAGLAEMGYVKGVAWGDIDNDGLPELFVTTKGSGNRLFHNDGADGKGGWRFRDITARAGVAEPKHAFATLFFDYDNDGWLDLLVNGYFTATLSDIPAFHLGLPNKAETPRLYRNNGDGTFREVAKQVGLDRVILPMALGCGDLDNDGWIDCYFGTGAPEYETLLPNRMFRNNRGRRFEDVTATGGFGQLQKGHGISFADFNRDGHQDVFEVLGGAFPGDAYISTLLENPGHPGHWLGLKLEGGKANRSAIGARVRVDLEDGRSLYRVVQPGSSFGDAPLELHIGLGTATRVTRIQVHWPGQKDAETFRPPPAVDRPYRLRQGASANPLEPIAVKAFKYRKGAALGSPHHAAH